MDKSANGRVTLRGHLDDVFLEGEWNLGGVLEIVLERGFQLIQRDRHIYTHTHTHTYTNTHTKYTHNTHTQNIHTHDTHNTQYTHHA